MVGVVSWGEAQDKAVLDTEQQRTKRLEYSRYFELVKPFFFKGFFVETDSRRRTA